MLPICESPEKAIEAIRAAPLENLQSVAWMEHEFLPSLGLHDEGTWPVHLQRFQAKGVRSWQWPNQLAPYLVHLSHRDIQNYLEIGLSHGGTFIVTCEYLLRFNPMLNAVGIDMELKPGARFYADFNKNVSVHQADSRSPEVRRLISGRTWGLSFVDGDHSEEGCWADYQSVRDYSRVVAFHDIANDTFPGVGAVWSRLTAAYPRQRTHEFIAQYPEIIREHRRIDYGIGLIEISL